MEAYELHTFQGRRWKVDSIFDERDLAIIEARRITENRHSAGVRVVEEIYHEDNCLATTRMIFLGGKVVRPGLALSVKTRLSKLMCENWNFR